MFPGMESNSNILNNLSAHVDSGDVLFVVSGNASNNQLALEALNKRCKAKCPGRKKLNRSLHSKVVDASEFAICDEVQCSDASKNARADEISIKNKISEVVIEKRSENIIEQPAGKLIEKKTKRLDGSNRIKIKPRGPPPVDSKWKREVILRQMKNHRVSSSSMDRRSQPKLMIRPAERLKVLQDVFDAFVSQRKWDTVSQDTENLSGIMSRIGLSKYGFKIANKSPYAMNEVKKTRRRARSVIDIVPRHHCFEVEDSRVPSYMGWYWTKCFSEIASTGWRPGAIPRNIRDIMTYFNGPCCSCMPSDVATCVTYDKKMAVEKADEQIVARKPTLRVVRRDGLYYVSMNPLKPSEELAQSQNPYLDDCPPIKFQIALNRNGKRIQQGDDDMGLLGYPCSELPAICEDNKEMQDLLNLLADECDNDKEFYKLAKTLCAKPSDLDIEFIAPGANASMNNSNYKEGIYKETQYDKNDYDDTFGNAHSLPIRSTEKKKKKLAAA